MVLEVLALDLMVDRLAAGLVRMVGLVVVVGPMAALVDLSSLLQAGLRISTVLAVEPVQVQPELLQVAGFLVVSQVHGYGQALPPASRPACWLAWPSGVAWLAGMILIEALPGPPGQPGRWQQVQPQL